MDMKKVLIISYMYPPIAGGGIQRVLKFIKYLPSYGIAPVVFAPKRAYWKVHDWKNLEMPYVKNTKTYRCGINRLEKYYDLRFRKGQERGFYLHLLGLKYIWFIDFFSEWYFECRKNLLDIAKFEEVDCVFTTSPPHSVHLFGMYLKRKLNIPWIMDLRDAMFDEPNIDSWNMAMLIQSYIEWFYEKKFYRFADKIVSVSQPILDSLLARHRFLNTRKLSLIPNGFDEEDYVGLKPDFGIPGKLSITYTGAFLGKRTPQYLLEAISLLVSQGKVGGNDISIRFVGSFSQKVRSIMDSFAELLPIEIIDYQPYEESLKYQLSADLLLLPLGVDESERGSQIFTGKFFEYIGSKKPIFALIPKGPLMDLIREGRFGIAVPPKDVSAIAEGFHRIYTEWKKDGAIRFKPDDSLQLQFSRKKLCRKLADIINGF